MRQAFENFRIGQAPYTDAELYRLVAAHTIETGGATCKADFDAQVRKIGSLEDANMVISLTDQRPGCRAQLKDGRFECKCGSAWSAEDRDLPACIKEADQ